MSYFSNQLRILIETLDISRAKLAELTGIAPATLHNYYHGNGRGPDVENLEKLCSVIENREERAQLVIAHLKDETPVSAADLVRILSFAEPFRSQELPDRSPRLPEAVEQDFAFLKEMAAKHPAVVDSIQSTVRILKSR